MERDPGRGTCAAAEDPGKNLVPTFCSPTVLQGGDSAPPQGQRPRGDSAPLPPRASSLRRQLLAPSQRGGSGAGRARSEAAPGTRLGRYADPAQSRAVELDSTQAKGKNGEDSGGGGRDTPCGDCCFQSFNFLHFLRRKRLDLGFPGPRR